MNILQEICRTPFLLTKPDVLLRTHTSSVQVRFMENNQPPIRTLSPGRVYRNEAISARAHCIFHQVEGLYIDKDVSFTTLSKHYFILLKRCLGTRQRFVYDRLIFLYRAQCRGRCFCNICSGKGCNV